jgi:steroid delta-isomerase-like uncharacterized protein
MTPTNTVEETRELVERYHAAWGNEELTAFPDILAEDVSVTFYDPTGGETRLGANELREYWTNSFATRSNPAIEIHEIVAEPGRAMSHVTYSYTHDEAEYGVPPTGNRVELEEWFTFRVEDGEIVELHSLANNLSRLRQLGIEIPIGS